MIKRQRLEELIRAYQLDCIRKRRRPSFDGLGRALGVTGHTVANYTSGYYAPGREYTDKPHPLRAVENQDFSLLRALFSEKS